MIQDTDAYSVKKNSVKNDTMNGLQRDYESLDIQPEQDHIGFDYSGNQLVIQNPKFVSFNQTVNKQEEMREWCALFRLLAKYEMHIEKQKSVLTGKPFILQNEKGKTGSQLHPFENAIFLLQDYTENGLLLFRSLSTNHQQRGRVNWSKTIQRSDEIVLEGTVIYNQLYFNNLQNRHQHPVTLLHTYVIKSICEVMGLKKQKNILESNLLSVDFSGNIIPSIISRYRQNMYVDRQKTVFSAIERYISYHGIAGWKNSSSNAFVKYTKKFDYIWEHMNQWVLEKKMLNNKKSTKLEEMLAALEGRYELHDPFSSEEKEEKNKIPRGLSQLRDILIERTIKNQSYLYVLDAKNYLVSFTDANCSLPKTPDIVKQIYYKDFLTKTKNKDGWGDDHIINAFLFPYSFPEEWRKKDNDDTPIRFIGSHVLEKNRDKNILCFVVDYKELRTAYLADDDQYGDKVLNYIKKIHDIELENQKNIGGITPCTNNT